MLMVAAACCGGALVIAADLDTSPNVAPPLALALSLGISYGNLLVIGSISNQVSCILYH